VINGGTTFGRPIHERILRQQLSLHTGDILSMGDGCTYTDELELAAYSLIVTKVRMSDHYVVCFIASKMASKMGDCFSKRDLDTAVVFTGITNELLTLNHTILQERNEMQNLYESIPTYITTLDTEGHILSLNKAAEAVVGDRQKHIGKTLRSIITENQYQRFMPFFYKAVSTRKPIELVVSFRSISGKVVANEMIITPLIDQSGKMTGVIFYGTDATDKKVYQKEIEQLRQYALIGEISTNIAHDIKNPLAGIRGMARLIQKNGRYDSEQIGLLDEIIGAVDRVNKTVDQLLSYAHLSSNSSANIANISQVLDNCIDAISFYHKFKQIQIHKKYDSNLPKINVKQIRIEQAFMNILLNSVQAIEESGNITVLTKYSVEQKAIFIYIIDDGIGFSKEDKEHVKEPFYTTKADGTGLGLSIVKKVVDEHGGKLHIESTPGLGTTVKLTLYC
jgi:PAS domain S-box-containing protein